MIRKIYHLLKRWISKYISHRMLKAETNKIKDKRRQKILSQYVLSEEQKNDILSKEPALSRYIKPYIGSEEYINGKTRYCFWLVV